MKHTIICIGILLLSLNAVKGQHAPQFSQYTFNKINFNPALVGAYEALTVSGFYRHQWFGVEGAPRTGLVNIIAPLTRHNTVLGMGLSYDQIGMTKTGTVSASYTYVIKFNNGVQVLGGLNGVVEYGRIDWTMADARDLNDIIMGGGAETTWKPNFGAGIALNTTTWYAGISMPRFLKYHLFHGDQGNNEEASVFRELYFMGGLDFRLGNNVRFRPGVLMSYNQFAPLDMALDASFLFNNQFILGAAYRLDDAITGFIQYRISPMWKMGLAYDFTVSRLNSYSNGTAEIMLEYSLDKAQDGTRHIRFF